METFNTYVFFLLATSKYNNTYVIIIYLIYEADLHKNTLSITTISVYWEILKIPHNKNNFNDYIYVEYFILYNPITLLLF